MSCEQHNVLESVIGDYRKVHAIRHNVHQDKSTGEQAASNQALYEDEIFRLVDMIPAIYPLVSFYYEDDQQLLVSPRFNYGFSFEAGSEKFYRGYLSEDILIGKASGSERMIQVRPGENPIVYLPEGTEVTVTQVYTEWESTRKRYAKWSPPFFDVATPIKPDLGKIVWADNLQHANKYDAIITAKEEELYSS